MVVIREVTAEAVSDLDELFGTDDNADRCWCMWFITSVREFHAAGREGNRQRLLELIGEDRRPVGLLAYDDEHPVGWCAVGPKHRYERAVKTPTLRAWRPADDATTWFVPCLFIRPESRQHGVAAALVGAAIDAARAGGATAIEAFPLAGERRRSGGSDIMTGTETLFANHGFAPAHRPSSNRVVMRLDL